MRPQRMSKPGASSALSLLSRPDVPPRRLPANPDPQHHLLLIGREAGFAATHLPPGGERTLLPYQGRRAGRRPYLVVLAVGVAAAVVRQNAAPAVEDVAGVALAALHAVVVAVALEADGGAAGLAHAHAAVVVAVGRAGDGCNGRRGSGWAVPRAANAFLPAIPHRSGDGGLVGRSSLTQY